MVEGGAYGLRLRWSTRRVMAAVASSAVALGFLGPDHLLGGVLLLIPSVPAVLLLRSRGEAATVAAIVVLLAGVLGPSLRHASGPARAARPDAGAKGPAVP